MTDWSPWFGDIDIMILLHDNYYISTAKIEDENNKMEDSTNNNERSMSVPNVNIPDGNLSFQVNETKIGRQF